MSHRPLAAAPTFIALAVIAMAWSVAAPAADRTVYIASFDKVRVQGPFEVRIETGRAPAATLTGDRQVIEAVEVQVEGATLVVRNAIGRWDERPRGAATSPVVITLATPDLVTASVTGGGRLSIGRMQGARVDLSVTGAGTITVREAVADAANAMIVGGGAIIVAGRAGKARLSTNGPGAIDAGGLEAGDLVVRLDGPGVTKARARYTALVVNTGIGRVTVAGQPKCTVKADAGGPVACGAGS